MNDQDPESQDPVWRLLGKARPVDVRPQFSQRVLEAVHLEREWKTRRWAWLRTVWTPPTRPVWLGAAAALVVTGWWVARPRNGSGVAKAPVVATIAPDPADELADQIASELVMIDEVDDLLAPESAQDLGEEDIEQLLF